MQHQGLPTVEGGGIQATKIIQPVMKQMIKQTAITSLGRVDDQYCPTLQHKIMRQANKKERIAYTF